MPAWPVPEVEVTPRAVVRAGVSLAWAENPVCQVLPFAFRTTTVVVSAGWDLRPSSPSPAGVGATERGGVRAPLGSPVGISPLNGLPRASPCLCRLLSRPSSSSCPFDVFVSSPGGVFLGSSSSRVVVAKLSLSRYLAAYTAQLRPSCSCVSYSYFFLALAGYFILALCRASFCVQLEWWKCLGSLWFLQESENFGSLRWQSTNVCGELVPLDFLKIMLIQVREVRARNVGVTVTVGTGTPESWGQFDVEEPSQAFLGICWPHGSFPSQLLVTPVPLKIFTLQAAWWKRLVIVIVCAVIRQMPRAVAYARVCRSLPLLCCCIPGLDAPTLSRCELVAFLLSSSTYCFSPSCSYFCAENINQPEKMWWFIYVGVFENNVLCCNLF